MNELLTNLLVTFIVATITLVVRYGIPMLKQAVEGTKLETAMQYASEFVKAAEQTMSELTGNDKKTWVTNILKGVLTAKNISLSDEQINAIIEAAVFDMNTNKQ